MTFPNSLNRTVGTASLLKQSISPNLRLQKNFENAMHFGAILVECHILPGQSCQCPHWVLWYSSNWYSAIEQNLQNA